MSKPVYLDAVEARLRARHGKALQRATEDLDRIRAIADPALRIAEIGAMYRIWAGLTEEALRARREVLTAALDAGMQKKDAAALVGVHPTALSKVGPKHTRKRAW